jgi:rhamnosyltransferase
MSSGAQIDRGVAPPTVCILLATFNGVQYIEDQIASIQRQTYEDWVILVSDDGSTDGTQEKLWQQAQSDPRIFIQAFSGTPSGGAKQNFARLLRHGLETRSNIFFLCDQDDVWEPDKIECQVKEFPQMGAEATSLLVHSDLIIVDDNVRPIHPSMMGYMALNARPSEPLNYLLSRNFVTGCASALNRRLLAEGLPIPDSAVMHDWWLALVASLGGDIRFIDRPLVKYRQHQFNTVGASGFWRGLNPANNWLVGWKAGNEEFLATFVQAESLLTDDRNREQWDQGRLSVLRTYVWLLNGSVSRRIDEARKLRLRQGGLLVRLIFWLRLISIRVKWTE